MGNKNEGGIAYQIMEASEQAMYVFSSEDFSVIYANSKAKQIFGEQVGDVPCYMWMETKERPCMDCPFMNLPLGEETIAERYYESFGTRIRVKAKAMQWEDGRKVVLCTVLNSNSILDIKQAGDILQNEYKEKLRLSGELYQAVVSQLQTIVFEYNYEKKTSYVSPLFEERFGVKRIQNIDFLQNDATKPLIYEEDRDIYQMLFGERTDDFREVTCRLCEVNGRVGWYRICIQFIHDDYGALNRVIGTLKDVDDTVKSHEILRHRSEYDALTDLCNVNRFYVDACKLIEDESREYAIISFDIDRFKMINDLFGMKTGDAVLQHVADVLRDIMTDESLCCRVHSDVFFVCIPFTKKGEIIKLIERIRKGIFRNDFSFDINTSFGVYLIQNRCIPINLMCDRAGLACRTVKNNAMKFCAFYDEQYRNEILKTTEIEKDMNVAISDKQFLMYLQPKYELVTGQICGAEVLARWKHPIKGLIQPNDFIPLFEKNGFIIRLDEYMWDQACRTLARWKNEGKQLIPLSVNISRYHIKNNDLIAAWKRLIKKYKVAPSDLTLEITETLFNDSNDLYDVLQQLQDMGFRLEVDDFGSGYSSLNMIRQVPINTIKIDKDFLDKKLSTEKGKIVVSHTIAMAKDLKLSVVAEGVETKEHVDFLKAAACDVAQGYYFAKPMPLEDFEREYFV